jgi:hypothetical protein
MRRGESTEEKGREKVRKKGASLVKRKSGSGVTPATELAHLRPTTPSTHTESPIEVDRIRRKEEPSPAHARKGKPRARTTARGEREQETGLERREPS